MYFVVEIHDVHTCFSKSLSTVIFFGDGVLLLLVLRVLHQEIEAFRREGPSVHGITDLSLRACATSWCLNRLMSISEADKFSTSSQSAPESSLWRICSVHVFISPFLLKSSLCSIDALCRACSPLYPVQLPIIQLVGRVCICRVPCGMFSISRSWKKVFSCFVLRGYVGVVDLV